MVQRSFYPLFLILVSAWLAGTALVDFLVVPTLFHNHSHFFEAGTIGILLFTKFNYIEIVVASVMVGMLALRLKERNPLHLGFFFIAVVLWLIIMSYFVYLIPKISHLTELWRKAESLGAISMNGIRDVQQEHQFYHGIYVGMDTVKLIVLIFLLGVGILKREKLT